MLLKWLSHLLSSLLVASLCALIISTVLSQTLMSSHYLEGQLTKADAYNRLSVALSAQVVQQSDAAANPLVATAVSKILTPDVLKQKINTAIDQLSLYYQGKGPAPSVDLSEFAPQVQAAGVPLPADNQLFQPIKLVPDSGTNKTVAYPGKSFAGAHAAALLSTIMLTLLLAAVSWQRRRYGALPGVAITVGVFVGALALILRSSVGALDHYIKFSTSSNAFAPLAHDLAKNITMDIGNRFGIIALICLVVGIIAGVIAGRLRPRIPASPGRQTPRGAIS